MAYKVIVTIATELDILEATDYYELQLQGLGVRFYKTIISYLRKLETNPAHYSYLFKEFRSVSAEVFPFLIIFKITSPDEVMVYGVMHTSRNPQIIERRTER